MKNIVLLTSFIAVLNMLSITGCSSEESVSNKQKDNANSEFIVINDKNISRKLFVEEMRFRGAITPGAMQNQKSMDKILDEVILLELMAQKAIEQGLDQEPKVQLAIKKLLANQYKKSQLTPQLKQLLVTDEEIIKYYEADITRYSSPHMVKTAILFMQFPANAEAKKSVLIDKMKDIREQAKKLKIDVSGFGKLAQQYSDDVDTKYKNGIMNWVSKGASIQRWQQDVVDAMFEIETIGDVSPIIEIRRGLVLLRLLDQRKEKTKPLKVVKNTVKNKLLAHKKQQWLTRHYKNLKDQSDITINEHLIGMLQKEHSNSLAANKNKLSSSAPPGFPIK